MTTARAPLRISFAGGGTDIEPYCLEFGGCVLSVAIKLYAYAILPAGMTYPNSIAHVIRNYYHYQPKGNFLIYSEAAPMSGLGGSASCFVAGIKVHRPDLSPVQIAELAFHLERKIMGIAGGKQDQYMAAHGGLNFLTFTKEGVSLERLQIPGGFDELLVLVYMGLRNHSGHDIIKDQMGRDNRRQFAQQKAIAKTMRQCLLDSRGPKLKEFGVLLDHAWKCKCEFSPYISREDITEFYDECLKSGAIGGKLTGAGGGGYMLLMEDPDKPGQLRKYLRRRNIDFVNVHFESEGVKCLEKKT